MEKVRATIRDVPDFPKKGIVFKDITPVLANGELLRDVIDAFVEEWRAESIDKILGIESRGFIIGAPLAYALGVGMVVGYSFLVELAFLNGARRLRPDKVHALVTYNS